MGNKVSFKEYMERQKKPIKLQCRICKYIWGYKGEKKIGFTSCPQCRNSNVNIHKHQVIEQDAEKTT